MSTEVLAPSAARPQEGHRALVRALIQAAFFLSLSVAVAVALVYFRKPIAQMGQWGYLGGFAAEMVNAATMFIPTPGSAITFSLGATLNPWVLGLVGGIGASIGELSGYLMGIGGRKVVENGRFYSRFHGLTRRWGGPVLFGFAILPVPFDFAGVWAGTARYPLWRFFLFVTPGKVIKVTGYAIAGSYSVYWLERLFS